jgi:hypothetical protein
VDEQLIKRLCAIVFVLERFIPRKRMVFIVEGDFDGVIDLLLEIGCGFSHGEHSGQLE